MLSPALLQNTQVTQSSLIPPSAPCFCCSNYCSVGFDTWKYLLIFKPPSWTQEMFSCSVFRGQFRRGRRGDFEHHSYLPSILMCPQYIVYPLYVHSSLLSIFPIWAQNWSWISVRLMCEPKDQPFSSLHQWPAARAKITDASQKFIHVR